MFNVIFVFSFLQLLIVLWILLLFQVFFLCIFAYRFTLLASLAFQSFAFHCCFLFAHFCYSGCFLCSCYIFVFSYNCSSGCFDLLFLFTSFYVCSLFIVCCLIFLVVVLCEMLFLLLLVAVVVRHLFRRSFLFGFFWLLFVYVFSCCF